MHAFVQLVAIVLPFVLAAPAAAARMPRGCADGRFVVTTGQELLGGGPDPAVLVVRGASLTVEGACPASGTATNRRKGTRVSAEWTRCGTLEKLRLRATARDCSTARGTLRTRRRRASLVATASACGDGIVDRGAGEECDGARACEAGLSCSPSCRCVEPLECVVAGYPCRWSDVSAEVRAQGIALAETAFATLAGGGTTRDAAQTLKGARLAELQYDEDLIRFRLPGGRAVWIAREGALTPRGGPAALGSVARSELPIGPRAVVSPGLRPKKAYVLDPYAWEPNDAGGRGMPMVGILDAIDDYAGHVRYLANTAQDGGGVGVAEFAQLAGNNVVIVNTHGAGICQDLETGTTIPCRTILNVQRVGDPDAALAEARQVGVDILMSSEGEWHLVVAADFFREAYPGGLRDALVVVSACRSRALSDIAHALEGDNSNVVGWDGPASYDGVATILDDFLRRLAQGRAVAEAYGSMGGAVTDAVYGSSLAIGSRSIRIRDLPRASDALTGGPLGSSGTIQVTGYPNDGLPDGLLLLTEFVGVHATEGDRYVVHFGVDGVDMGSRPLGEIAAPVGEWEWKGEAALDLGYDVGEGQPLDLLITVDLPEGGTSAFAATLTVAGDAFTPGRVWQGTFTRTSAAGAGPHWRLEVIATFERDGSESPTSKYPTYLLRNGTMTWSLLPGGECQYTATTTTIALGADEYSSFTFDLTKQPFEFSGSASSTGPQVNMTVDCPDLGDTNVSVEAGGSWFLAPRSEHYAVTSPSVAGSFNNGSAVASTFEWTLTRVE